MRRFLFGIALIAISMATTLDIHAQNMGGTVFSMLPQVQAELSRRGLTESEVRLRLIRNGIDVDRIPPTELLRYQQRILAVVEELEAEKRLEQERLLPVRLDSLNQSNRILPENSEKPAPKDSVVVRNIYGHNLFLNQSLDVFQTTDGGRAPSTYVLGAGDQVRITIFGISQADILVEINDEGFIQPTGMPKIFLQGVTLERARVLLLQRFGPFYTFRAEQFAMSIQSARTVTVNVFGESTIKGSFSISALNTAFNALSAAGGPTEIGSVRNIQVIRGSERKTLDVYAFMNDPSVVFQFDLQHNDIIHVPVAETIVEVTGAVNRPMKYELTDAETLLDLIHYAGGIRADAYPDFVQIQRFENGSIQFFEYDLSSVLSGSERIALKNGDQVRLRQINAAVKQQVISAGSVFYPEAFGYTAGMTAGDLVKLSGGLLPSASDVAYVVRRDLRDTTRSEYLPVNLFTSKGLGFVLQANDNMMVYDRTLYGTVGDVRITGAVKQPTELVFDPTLTLADVMKSAGGFALGAAQNRVEVFRTTIATDRPVSLSMITLVIDSLFDVVGGDDMAFQLMPYDQIVVRQTPGFQLNRTVELNGEVQYPGVYVLESRQTTLSDVVAAAGGVRDAADLRGIRLFRTYRNRGFIVSDLSMAMRNPGYIIHDPILFEGDVITIPRTENVVSINPVGVRYMFAADPELAGNRLEVIFQGAKSAHWYITQFAGGFEKEANKSSVTVTLPNGQVKSTRRFLFIRNYPKVESGSLISVQMKPTPNSDIRKKIDWDQISNRTLQTTTTLLTLLLLSRQL